MQNKVGNKKITASQIFSIVVAVLLVIAHVAIVIVGVRAFKYYSIYPELFIYGFGIIVCLFIIVDIVYAIGVKHNDLVQKIVVCVLALLLAVGGLYGTVVMEKTDEVVENVVETEGEERFETVSGLFATYDSKYANITKLDDLKSIDNLHVGTLIETTEDSISSLGLAELDNAGIKYESKGYTNNTDLLFALIGGEVDVAVFTSVYKAVFRADENVDYTQYLDQMNEFGEFSKDIKVEANTSTKDLSKDPFNVLLIGWSPIIGSDTIGLADAIIVCTVNPQTYTVSMMSIARDSYVPITCYGGQCDKINSGRGTSMDCFVSTVENLIGDDIDFYMEIGFAGFALLVDCVGGVEIDNPVSFELDGVYVPAGQYVAEGWQALQFARERHHMPNGDFDRQQHQKEVIMEVAKKFLKHDLTFALDVFNEVSSFVNTNLTLNQLSGVFNMLKSTKNYTGLSLFNILDMHALRITGYADWHYSDEYELPLWIYRLYQGSLDESLEHMREVKGNFKTINQEKEFGFDVENPYVREPFYSLEYDEVEVHETLPPFYKNLTSMTYADAMAWAKENGATLIATFIDSSSDKYNPDLEGMVISQSVPYGKKVSKYPVCNITVMGTGKRKVTIPDYEGWDIDRAKTWCADNNLEYSTTVKFIDGKNSEGKNGQVYEMTYNEDSEKVYIKYYKSCGDNATPTADGSGCSCASGYGNDESGACVLKKTYKYVKDGATIETIESVTKPNWNYGDEDTVCKWSSDGVTYNCTSHHWDNGEVKREATCKEEGIIEYHCTDEGCSKTKIVRTPKVDHTWDEGTITKEPTCTNKGRMTYECTKCHEKYNEDINELGHDWDGGVITIEATIDAPGVITYTCNRCGETKEEEIPQLES